MVTVAILAVVVSRSNGHTAGLCCQVRNTLMRHSARCHAEQRGVRLDTKQGVERGSRQEEVGSTGLRAVRLEGGPPDSTVSVQAESFADRFSAGIPCSLPQGGWTYGIRQQDRGR